MISKTTFAGAVALLGVPMLCCVTRAADPPPAPGPQTDWKSGSHHLTVDGRDRTFLLDVPSGLKPGAPLVLVFHGFTGSAQDARNTTGFAAVAEKHGFVVVYPDGTRDSKGQSFFNVGYAFHRDQTVDDVRFARTLPRTLTTNGEPTAETLWRFFEAHLPKTR